MDPENLANNGKENEELEEAQVLHKLVDALHEEWFPELSYLEVIENMCKSGTMTAQLMQHYLRALPLLQPLAYVIEILFIHLGLE